MRELGRDSLISRRQLIRQLSVAVGLLAIGVPRSAHAATIQAALAIAQGALAAARLFGPKGPSIGSLLNLQTQLIRVISDQIGLLNLGINTIIEELTEIKKLTIDVPDKTVFALYKRRLKGLAIQYQEFMATYSNYVTTRGIPKAQTYVKEKMEVELLTPLREVRSVFLTYDEDVVVTLLAMAAKIETHAMIMSGYEKPERDAAIHSYLQWCEARRKSSDSLEVQLQGNRKLTEKVKQEFLAAEQTPLHQRFCLRGLKSHNMSFGPCQSLHLGGEWTHRKPTPLALKSGCFRPVFALI